MMPITLLVADNDRDFLTLAKIYLERCGYQVLTAHTLADARAILETRPLALALLDFRLVNDDDPIDQSGLTLARATAHAFSVPKIILTRFDRADYATQALRPSHGHQSPVVDFVLKQHGLEAMKAAIDRWLLRANVFICYARADQDQVSQLYQNLAAVGFAPWLDTQDLQPGEEFGVAIEHAIRKADCCLVCWSEQSSGRRGFIQRELRLVLDKCSEALEADICVVPVRLDPSEISHDALRKFQWVELYRPDGVQRLVQAIRTSALQRRSTPAR